MSTSLNMILGKFPERFLEYALKSTKGMIDEAVIVDTWPGENPNLEVVHDVLPDAKIVQYHHQGKEDFSYGAARNLAKEHSSCDWILRQDADEVHYPEFAEIIKNIPAGFDAVRCYFFHLVNSPFLCQYTEPKNILYRRHLSYDSRVHEELLNPGAIWTTNYHFAHYGYCRPPWEVFQRWLWYMHLDPKIPDTWYDGRNPHLIIADRSAVCKDFPLEMHPPVLIPWLENEIALPVALVVGTDIEPQPVHHRVEVYKINFDGTYAHDMNKILKKSLHDRQTRYIAVLPPWVQPFDNDWLGNIIRSLAAEPDLGRAIIGGSQELGFVMPNYVFEHVGGFDEHLQTMKAHQLDWDARLEQNQWRTIEMDIAATISDANPEEPTQAERDYLKKKHG